MAGAAGDAGPEDTRVGPGRPCAQAAERGDVLRREHSLVRRRLPSRSTTRQKNAPAARGQRRQRESMGMGRWCAQVGCRTTTGRRPLTDGASSPAGTPPRPAMAQGAGGDAGVGNWVGKAGGRWPASSDRPCPSRGGIEERGRGGARGGGWTVKMKGIGGV